MERLFSDWLDKPFARLGRQPTLVVERNDKAYDSDSFRELLRPDGITPVIRGRSNRKKRIRYEKKPTIATSLSAASVDGFQAHWHALRQTRPKLLFQRVSCHRRWSTGCGQRALRLHRQTKPLFLRNLPWH
jgi:hypothetical protein